MDLELSDHYTQVLSTPLTNLSNMTQRSNEDNFKVENIQKFLYLQSQVTWQEVYIESDVNAKHTTLLNICHYYNMYNLGGGGSNSPPIFLYLRIVLCESYIYWTVHHLDS